MRKYVRHFAWKAVQDFAFIVGFPVVAPIYRIVLIAALHGLGYGNNRSHIHSGEARFVRTVLVPAQIRTLIDVGSNVGQYGHLLSKYLPGPVYSIEPLASTFKELQKQATQKMRVFHYAVSDANGEMQMYSRGEHWEGASLHSGLVKNASVVETVPVITLDSFIDKHSVRDIDFVKIDTEGHEMEVLRGMHGLIENNPPRFIQFEFGAAHLKRGHTLYHFQQQLPGYALFRLMPHGMVPVNAEESTDNFFMFSNIIAKHNGRGVTGTAL